jgi:hypothetical protein
MIFFVTLTRIEPSPANIVREESPILLCHALKGAPFFGCAHSSVTLQWYRPSAFANDGPVIAVVMILELHLNQPRASSHIWFDPPTVSKQSFTKAKYGCKVEHGTVRATHDGESIDGTRSLEYLCAATHARSRMLCLQAHRPPLYLRGMSRRPLR